MGKQPYTDTVSEAKQKQFASYLNDDEEMVLFTTVSNEYLLHKFIIHFSLSCLITIPVLFGVHKILGFDLMYSMGVGLFLALVYASQRYYFTKEGIQYILTDKRLIVQIGYFQVTLYSANYNKITHIEVIQSILDRLIYKHGQVIVRTAGSDEKSIEIDYVNQPVAFKNVLERLISSERQRYGHTSI